MTTEHKTQDQTKSASARPKFRAWLVQDTPEGEAHWTELSGLWPTKSGTGFKGALRTPLADLISKRPGLRSVLGHITEKPGLIRAAGIAWSSRRLPGVMHGNVSPWPVASGRSRRSKSANAPRLSVISSGKCCSGWCSRSNCVLQQKRKGSIPLKLQKSCAPTRVFSKNVPSRTSSITRRSVMITTTMIVMVVTMTMVTRRSGAGNSARQTKA